MKIKNIQTILCVTCLFFICAKGIAQNNLKASIDTCKAHKIGVQNQISLKRTSKYQKINNTLAGDSLRVVSAKHDEDKGIPSIKTDESKIQSMIESKKKLNTKPLPNTKAFSDSTSSNNNKMYKSIKR